MTQGYFVPQTADQIIDQVFAGIRRLHLVVSPRGPSFSGHLRKHGRRTPAMNCASTCTDLLARKRSRRRSAKFYSHVLPSPQVRTLSDRAVIGRNWALCGDAAAWVDPLTGEGLFLRHALWGNSGTIACRGLPGEIPGTGAGFVFAGAGICRSHRAALLSRVVLGHGGHDAHGAVPAAQRGVSSIAFGFVLWDAGLHDVEAASAAAISAGRSSQFVNSVLRFDHPSAKVPASDAAAD